MKVLLYIVLAWIIICIIWATLSSLVKTIWQRANPKSWCLHEASASMGVVPIEKLYKRYGEVKATEFLIIELKARMQQVKALLYNPMLDQDSGSFEKELHKFARLMGSAILGLRQMELAEEWFPLLRILVARFLLLEPEKLKQTVVVHIPLFTQAEESEIDNPIVQTLKWALKELEDTSLASAVSFPPTPFT